MSYLEVENLKKSFGETEVLKGVSFDIERGEVLSVIGSSGGGKTTLLRCLNFLAFADEGSVYLEENVIYDGKATNGGKYMSEAEIARIRLDFGLVFQNFNLFPQYTASQNISLPIKLLNEKKIKAGEEPLCEDEKAYSDEMLKKVGLSGKENFYPHELSGGQQQRVAIARAMSLKPKILCFDEPTSALDPLLTNEVVKVIKELKSNGQTIIIVTHDMDFALKASDKVLYLSDGKVKFIGTPEEISLTENEEIRSFMRALED